MSERNSDDRREAARRGHHSCVQCGGMYTYQEMDGDKCNGLSGTEEIAMTEFQRQSFKQFDSASDAFDFCREVNEPVKATFVFEGYREYSLIYPSGHAKVLERFAVEPESERSCLSFYEGGEGCFKPDRP